MFNEDFDSDNSEGEPTVTVPMEDVFKANEFIGELNSNNEKLKDSFNPEPICQIEEATRGQSKNIDALFTERVESQLLYFHLSNISDLLHVQTIIFQNDLWGSLRSQRTTPAMSFGTLDEPIAIHKYFKKYKHAHKQVVEKVV